MLDQQQYSSHWQRNLRRRPSPQQPNVNVPAPPDPTGISPDADHSSHQINGSSITSLIDENETAFPQPPMVRERIQSLHRQEPCRLAWEHLLNHNRENSQANADWYPFKNELGLLLFAGRYDPSLNITRAVLQYFLKILRTLQKAGHIVPEYDIPKAAQTVEEWWKFIPQPPICKISNHFCTLYSTCQTTFSKCILCFVLHKIFSI